MIFLIKAAAVRIPEHRYSVLLFHMLSFLCCVAARSLAAAATTLRTLSVDALNLHVPGRQLVGRGNANPPPMQIQTRPHAAPGSCGACMHASHRPST